MVENLIHRRVYDIEFIIDDTVRSFGIYDKHSKEFLVTYDGKLVGKNVEHVIVIEELILELPEHISLDKILGECKRHCRRLVYTSVQSEGGQGWVHHDDRRSCNEQVKTLNNKELLNFLIFLDKMS